MKTLKNKINTITLITFIFVSLVISSCKKDKKTSPTDTEPPVPVGTIAFHMHITNGDEEIEAGDTVVNPGTSQKYILDRARFYMSGFVLHKSDGTDIAIKDAYILKSLEEEEYIIGQVPTGNYKSVSFNLGLDPSVNATLPASHSGVLGVQEPSMWFGTTTQSYVFLDVSGSADTTGQQNAEPDKKFTYQLGGNNQLRTIHMPALSEMGLSALTVTSDNSPGLPAKFHLLCDFGLLLNSVNFKTDNETATPFNSDSLSTKAILNNVTKMFRYEK